MLDHTSDRVTVGRAIVDQHTGARVASVAVDGRHVGIVFGRPEHGRVWWDHVVTTADRPTYADRVRAVYPVTERRQAVDALLEAVTR